MSVTPYRLAVFVNTMLEYTSLYYYRYTVEFINLVICMATYTFIIFYNISFITRTLLVIFCFYRNPEDPVVAHWIRDKLLATKTIFFLNYAINFVLYSLAGANYRTAVLNMLPSFCCKQLDRNISNQPAGSLALHRMTSMTALSSVRVLDVRRPTNV